MNKKESQNQVSIIINGVRYDASGFDLDTVTHWQGFVFPKKKKNY